MKYLNIILLSLILIVHIGCVNSTQNRLHCKQMNYDQAVELVKQYVLEMKYYEKEEDIRFIYEPNNYCWLVYEISRNAKLLEDYGLLNRNYYAFPLLGEKAGDRGDDLFIFIDRDKSQIFGVRSGWSFENVEYRYIQEDNKTPQIFSYDRAVQVMKQYSLDLGLYGCESDIRFVYESNNGYWNRHIVAHPELLKMCSLINKSYYAFNLLNIDDGAVSDYAYVFVDKDKKQVIGILYKDRRFVENKEK